MLCVMVCGTVWCDVEYGVVCGMVLWVWCEMVCYGIV